MALWIDMVKVTLRAGLARLAVRCLQVRNLGHLVVPRPCFSGVNGPRTSIRQGTQYVFSAKYGCTRRQPSRLLPSPPSMSGCELPSDHCAHGLVFRAHARLQSTAPLAAVQQFFQDWDRRSRRAGEVHRSMLRACVLPRAQRE